MINIWKKRPEGALAELWSQFGFIWRWSNASSSLSQDHLICDHHTTRRVFYRENTVSRGNIKSCRSEWFNSRPFIERRGWQARVMKSTCISFFFTLCLAILGCEWLRFRALKTRVLRVRSCLFLRETGKSFFYSDFIYCEDMQMSAPDCICSHYTNAIELST